MKNIIGKIFRNPFTHLIIGFAMIIASMALVSFASVALKLPENAANGFVEILISCMLAIFTFKLYLRFVERSNSDELPFGSKLVELVAGFIAGLVIFSIVCAVIFALGGIKVIGFGKGADIFPVLAMSIGAGIIEEILFRGIILRNLEKLTGSLIALAISSALFGAVHLSNPNATLFSAFAIMLEAGILLGAAYFLTRNLWLAIGIHIGWNFTQGWVFALPVSGSKQMSGLLITKIDGNPLISGGGFGPEASVVTVIIVTLVGLWVLKMAYGRKNIIGAPWNKANLKELSETITD